LILCRFRHSAVHGSDNHLFSTLYNVHCAADAKRAAVEHIEHIEHIDISYFVIHVPVAHQFLDDADVFYPAPATEWRYLA
jgi:hypothetical protein